MNITTAACLRPNCERKRVEPVIEVQKLLGEVRDAWAEMLSKHGGDRPVVSRNGDRGGRCF